MDTRKLLCGTIYVRLCAPIDLYAPEKSRTRGLLRVKLPTVFFPLRAIRHHYCYYLFTAVFRNEKQTHTHTYIYMRTQATRAINMKYCLIEDIVLKTLPRAFFPRFFYYSLFIYYFPHPLSPRSLGSLIVYTLSRRTLLGTKRRKKIIIIKGNK